ncbi:MAG: selenoprotein O, partial [Sphingobium sp.]
MILSPQAAKYTPATDIKVIPGIGDPVKAADFPETILRFRNDRWAQSVGLQDLTDKQWIANFGRFEPLKGTLGEPLAL